MDIYMDIYTYPNSSKYPCSFFSSFALTTCAATAARVSWWRERARAVRCWCGTKCRPTARRECCWDQGPTRCWRRTKFERIGVGASSSWRGHGKEIAYIYMFICVDR